MDSRVNARAEEWTSYEVETVDALKGFRYRKADPETDVYGGWMTGRQEATGFFRTQKIGDRWWFIDPEGWPYIFKGVAVFSMGGSDRQKEALVNTFGTPEHWAEDQQDMLRSYGFNGLGAWSAVDIVRKSPDPMPYTVIVSPMGMYRSVHKKKFGGKYHQSGWQGYRFDLAMVFDPEFDTFVEKALKPIEKFRDDKFLVGYFTDNEIPWVNDALDRHLLRAFYVPKPDRFHHSLQCAAPGAFALQGPVFPLSPASPHAASALPLRLPHIFSVSVQGSRIYADALQLESPCLRTGFANRRCFDAA